MSNIIIGYASATGAGTVSATTQSFGGAKTFVDGYSGNTPFLGHGNTAVITTAVTTSITTYANDVIPAFISGTPALSAGTITVTFAKTGYYRITNVGLLIPVATFTGNSIVQSQFGGTVTNYGPVTQKSSVPSASNDLSLTSVAIVRATAVSQTVTFSPLYFATSSGNVTGYVYLSIEPI